LTPSRHRLAQATTVGGCSRPVRLRGQVHRVDPATGEVLRTLNTDDTPDGVIYTACGDRRASVCPACAETYRADTYELIRAGLADGKGVPGSVAAHPCVFATFTAPSFGHVHARITGPGGQVLRCRPRRKRSACPHGRSLSCPAATATPTPAPVSRCARTATTTQAPWSGTPTPPNCGGAPPSPCGAAWTSSPATTTPASSAVPHPARPKGWDITWGPQLDIRTVRMSSTGEVTDTAVASYLAKYATKSTEAVGLATVRITTGKLHAYASPFTHHGRLIRTAWQLGRHPHEDSRRCGGGHTCSDSAATSPSNPAATSPPCVPCAPPGSPGGAASTAARKPPSSSAPCPTPEPGGAPWR
jgi:hypothetical protein